VVRDWFNSLSLREPSQEQIDVIADCHLSLRVVARAGSGKTHTIAYKILFLIHFLGIEPEKIMALTFNASAAKELKNRVQAYQESAGLPSLGPPHALTFDSLAFNLVNPTSTILTDQGGMRDRFIDDMLREVLDSNTELCGRIEALMLQSFRDDWERTLRMLSDTTPSRLDYLRSHLCDESIDGKPVKSRGEKRIADFLFEHGIPYNYEYPFATFDSKVIRPDFFLVSHKTIIEYYGLAGDPAYDETIRLKRTYWRSRPDLQVIEIYPNQICSQHRSFADSKDEDYLYLRNLLETKTGERSRQLELNLLTDEQILEQLRSRVRTRFGKLVSSAISRVGQSLASEAELSQQICHFESITQEEAGFLQLLPDFLVAYNDRLEQMNHTDFNHIKKMAIRMISSGSLILDYKQRHLNLGELRFIFVDEFQDFSDLFKHLLLAILKQSPYAVLNAVGDDWQMINRFAGSKPELFHEFENDYPDPRTLYLTTNYRSDAQIVNFCNQLMVNRGRFSTPFSHNSSNNARLAILHHDRLSLTPREEYLFKTEMLLPSIMRIIGKSIERFEFTGRQDDEMVVFFISRTNDPLSLRFQDFMIPRSLRGREIINHFIDHCIPPEAAPFMTAKTAHTSKGLESECVVVDPDKFPLIHPSSIFLRFFGDTVENLIEDERRLFYVACSRAKKWLIFLRQACLAKRVFLDDVSSMPTVFSWRWFESCISTPEDLFLMIIQPKDSLDALFQAEPHLRARDFLFKRIDDMPTRYRYFQKSLVETISALEEIAQECIDISLEYRVVDGLGREVYVHPGPVAISEFISRHAT
jgi:DNA helicase-4